MTYTAYRSPIPTILDGGAVEIQSNNERRYSSGYSLRVPSVAETALIFQFSFSQTASFAPAVTRNHPHYKHLDCRHHNRLPMPQSSYL